jgi:hypothetical protein
LRDRDREREREREINRGERERKRKREREKEEERERCRICPEWLFLFLKGMTGALAPYSYLLLYTYLSSLDSENINMIGRICSRVIQGDEASTTAGTAICHFCCKLRQSKHTFNK